MPTSILDAIRMGQWDYEPDEEVGGQFAETKALPGTEEKLKILAERVRRGLPLWHPADRHSYDDQD